MGRKYTLPTPTYIPGQAEKFLRTQFQLEEVGQGDIQTICENVITNLYWSLTISDMELRIFQSHHSKPTRWKFLVGILGKYFSGVRDIPLHQPFVRLSHFVTRLSHRLEEFSSFKLKTGQFNMTIKQMTLDHCVWNVKMWLVF